MPDSTSFDLGLIHVFRPMGSRRVHLRVHVGVPDPGTDRQSGDPGTDLGSVAGPLSVANLLPGHAGRAGQRLQRDGRQHGWHRGPLVQFRQRASERLSVQLLPAIAGANPLALTGANPGTGHFGADRKSDPISDWVSDTGAANS